MRKRWVMMALFLGCSTQAALAEDIGLSKEYSFCLDAAGGVTMSMIDCIHQETERQDLRLNKAYKMVMETLTPERKNELKKAQRAWIAFRDGNCQFYADPEGGSIAGISANDCYLRATASRASELESFFNREGH
ncbi:MAG: lysozyme inhibitor LprI family protein [Desulfobulbus sp.]